MARDSWQVINFLVRRIGHDQSELVRLFNQVRGRTKTAQGLRELEKPVPCKFVGGIVGSRSDKVADKLRRRGLLVVKAGRTLYCDETDAAKVFRKFQRYLKNREFD